MGQQHTSAPSSPASHSPGECHTLNQSSSSQLLLEHFTPCPGAPPPLQRFSPEHTPLSREGTWRCSSQSCRDRGQQCFPPMTNSNAHFHPCGFCSKKLKQSSAPGRARGSPAQPAATTVTLGAAGWLHGSSAVSLSGGTQDQEKQTCRKMEKGHI